MSNENRLQQLESQIAEMSARHRRRGWRTRWAAIGAAVAISLGGGFTVLRSVSAAPGDVIQNSFVPLAPVRILDTRPAPDNVGGFVGPLSAGGTHTFQVTGLNGVPANATAVVLNVTVTQTSEPSFLTAFPAGTTPPVVSNLNWVGGTTIPNLVTVKLGAGGKVSVFNKFGTTHVLADIAGYYVPSSGKTITLDILGHPIADSAVFQEGFVANGGLGFRDAQFDDASFNFVVPPDYTPGTNIVGTFTWHTSAVACGVSWRSNYTSVSRAGSVHLFGNMTDPAGALAGSTSNLVQSATFTLTATTPLLPGDNYTFGIFRGGTAPNDTCAQTARIDSMVITYE